MPFEENIKIATKALQKIRNKNVSSNDIIPQVDLPMFELHMMPQNISKFGQNRVKLYEEHAIASRIRYKFIEQADKLGFIGCHKLFSISSAAIDYGVGECQDLSVSVMLSLIEEGYKDFAIASFGAKPKKEDHCVLLWGYKDNMFPQTHFGIEELLKASKDLIIIDPLLDHVGRLCDYLDEQRPFLKVHNLTLITHMMTIDEGIYSHSKMVLSKVKESAERLLSSANPSPAHFSRDSLDWCKEKILSEDTFLLHLLKKSSLPFFGVKDDEYRLDAVVPVSNTEETAKALQIRQKYEHGYFCAGPVMGSRFFVLPQINVEPLAGKISADPPKLMLD